MRIGYDTLVENPLSPSSAIVYLKRVLAAMCRLAPEHEIYALVSPKNRSLFDLGYPNLRLVNCLASNERVPLRIAAQQLYVPLIAKRHRLDVIHAINQVPLAAPVATVVKTCTLHHHLTPEEFNREGAERRPVENRGRLAYRRIVLDASARRATLVLANSHYTASKIQEYMRVPADRVRVVYEAVDEEFGDAGSVPPRLADVPARLGLDRPYVLYVSNLWFYKNPDGALRSFAAQHRRYGDDLQLAVAGPDDYGRIPPLRDLAATLGVADRVKFLGRVARDELIALYRSARVVLYPSRAETFGKPVVEAMKAGVPAVLANAGSLPEIAGDAALYAAPDDVDGLAEALHAAACLDDVRERLLAAGRLRARDFDWERTARGTLDVCLDAVGIHQGARPAPTPGGRRG